MIDREKFNNSRLKWIGAVRGATGTHYISERTSTHVGNAAAKLLSRWVPAPYSGLVRTGIVIATYAITYREIDKELERSTEEYFAN